MSFRLYTPAFLLALLAMHLTCLQVVHAQWRIPYILPEQQSTRIRQPADLLPAPVPNVPRPPTVRDPRFDAEPRYLTLDQAISISLANSRVVRVLSGVAASSSGRTIYDAAVANTQIDNANAAFDPSLRIDNTFSQNDRAIGAFNPAPPPASLIVGSLTESYNFSMGVSKPTSTGGTFDLAVNSNTNRTRPGPAPLNPAANSTVDLTLRQPLLQGGGFAVNQVPIVLARIDTERSYFQYKNAVQQNVRGVIEAYWSLVQARTNLWAREIQVDQARFAYERAKGRKEAGDASIGDVAQTEVALENFRVSVIDAKASVLQQEAALLNLLGLPPYDPQRPTPTTPPTDEDLMLNWRSMLQLAEQNRPDIIELKLILEADQQRLIQSRNTASPRLDAVALYRWNGLEGVTPSGGNLRSQPGDFADWSVGVNFSVPFGLRRERAGVRQQELIIARDRANLDQGLHAAVHQIALSMRNLDSLYLRYKRLKAVRAAAKVNVQEQLERYREELVLYIVVLQAITDWGNAVSQEAQALTQYNTELANLEFQTGTILESHGVAFYEERFGAIGPCGLFGETRVYPHSNPPTPNSERYPPGQQRGAEEFFDLRDPRLE